MKNDDENKSSMEKYNRGYELKEAFDWTSILIVWRQLQEEYIDALIIE